MTIGVDQVVRIQGREFSGRSASMKLNGVGPYVGISTVDWGSKRMPTAVYGMDPSGEPIGSTRGKVEYEPVAIKMLRSTFNMIKPQLALLGKGSYGSAQFIASISLSEGTLLAPEVITFTGCRVAENKGSIDVSSDDPLYATIALFVTGIRENGLGIGAVVE